MDTFVCTIKSTVAQENLQVVSVVQAFRFCRLAGTIHDGSKEEFVSNPTRHAVPITPAAVAVVYFTIPVLVCRAFIRPVADLPTLIADIISFSVSITFVLSAVATAIGAIGCLGIHQIVVHEWKLGLLVAMRSTDCCRRRWWQRSS